MGEAITLKARRVVEIVPSAPFNFDPTMHKPDHFPSSDNAWQPGIRWQTMRWQDRHLGLKFENQGTIDQPRIRLSVWSEDCLDQDLVDELIDEINFRYNLQMDLARFNQRFRDDPHLGPLIERWRGMRPLNCSSLYEYLIIAIVLQNAAVRRSVGMLRALFEKYGTLLHYDGRALYGFWTPEEIDRATEQELRDLKVGYRAKPIKRVTEAFAGKAMDEFPLRGKPVEEQREALLRLYGIGPASVGYILFDVFKDWDQLDYIPPWEQKIYSKLFFDRDPNEPVPTEQIVGLLNDRFGGYRGLAVHYFWEDLFWRRKYEPVDWLEKLIRL